MTARLYTLYTHPPTHIHIFYSTMSVHEGLGSMLILYLGYSFRG
jgi:hypothetical protein